MQQNNVRLSNMYAMDMNDHSNDSLPPPSTIPAHRRGTLLSTAIFLYAATSPVNGFFGGALYSRLGGM